MAYCYQTRIYGMWIDDDDDDDVFCCSVVGYCGSVYKHSMYWSIACSRSLYFCWIECLNCDFKLLRDYFIVQNQVFIVTILCTVSSFEILKWKWLEPPWRWWYGTETCWGTNTIMIYVILTCILLVNKHASYQHIWSIIWRTHLTKWVTI
jgi:hypothetical protein